MKILLNVAGLLSWVVLLMVGAAPFWLCGIMAGLCMAGAISYGFKKTPKTGKLNYISITTKPVHLSISHGRIPPPGPGCNTPADPDNDCEYAMRMFSMIPNSPHYDTYSIGILRKASTP